MTLIYASHFSYIGGEQEGRKEGRSNVLGPAGSRVVGKGMTSPAGHLFACDKGVGSFFREGKITFGKFKLMSCIKLSFHLR